MCDVLVSYCMQLEKQSLDDLLQIALKLCTLQLSETFLGVIDNLLLVEDLEFKDSNEEAKTSGRWLAVYTVCTPLFVCIRCLSLCKAECAIPCIPFLLICLFHHMHLFLTHSFFSFDLPLSLLSSP